MCIYFREIDQNSRNLRKLEHTEISTLKVQKMVAKSSMTMKTYKVSIKENKIKTSIKEIKCTVKNKLPSWVSIAAGSLSYDGKSCRHQISWIQRADKAIGEMGLASQLDIYLE